MKNKLLDFVIKGVTRFKISSMFLITSLVFSLITVNLDNFNLISDHLLKDFTKVIISFNIGLLISIGIELLKEKKGSNFKFILDYINIVYICIFYYFFNFGDFLYPILNFICFIGVIFFIPFYNQKIQTKNFLNYFYNISYNIFKSIVYGLLVFLLGLAAIFSIDSLFEISNTFQDVLYSNWSVISLMFLPVLFFFGDLKSKTSLYNKIPDNKFIDFLLKYVLSIFVSVYFLILYSYSIKVLFNLDNWPSGVIPWLIIMFSLIGYVSYILSKKYEDENKIIRIYRIILPVGVLIQTFLLFYAIGVRIGEYGLTTNRYLIVIFGIYLLVISSYLIISKNKNLVIIPALVSIFSFIISFGPWGVIDLPYKLQYNSLINTLEANNILVNGEIKINKDLTLKKTESNNIYSKIEYLCEYKKCESIKNLFKNILSEDEFKEESSWLVVNTITKKIGVYSIHEYGYQDFNSEYYSINSENEYLFENIKNYKEIYQINGFIPDNKEKIGIYDCKNEEIKIYNEEGIVQDTVKLNNFLVNIYNKYSPDYSQIIAKQKDLIFENNDYKIIFKGLRLKNYNYSGNNNSDYCYGEGYILEK